MKILYDKNGYLLGKTEGEWSNTFAVDMYGVYEHSIETLPLYQGKNLKDCVDWMKTHSIISKEEVLILMENDMLPAVEVIMDEEREILTKKEPEVKDLVDEPLPPDEELFSIVCRKCAKKTNMLHCKFDGEGNIICSHCGGIN